MGTDRRVMRRKRPPMAVAGLADELVRWKTDAAPTAVPDEQGRIYVSLYHPHPPKLADSNLVSFDRDQSLVGLHEDAPERPLDLASASADERLH